MIDQTQTTQMLTAWCLQRTGRIKLQVQPHHQHLIITETLILANVMHNQHLMVRHLQAAE